MKEFDLTRQPQNTYSGSMPEPGNGEGQFVQPKPQEISPTEKTRLIREQFEKSNQARIKNGEKITPEELQTQRIMAESGVAPIAGGADVPPEDVIREIAEGRGGEFLEADINEALTAGLGLTQEDIAGATLEQKIGMIRAGEGGRGQEPPRNPPTAEGGKAYDGEGASRGSEFSPQLGVAEFNEEPVANVLRAAESNFKYARDDESRYEALVGALERIEMISAEHREGESEAETRRIDQLSGEKSLARSRIRGQIEEWQLSRMTDEGYEQNEKGEKRIRRSLPQEWEPGKNLLVNAIRAEGDYASKMDNIEKIIDSLDPNDRSSTGILTAALYEVQGEIELGPVIEDTLEYSLEVFLNRADSDPGADYPQFTFTESENMAIITHAGRRFDQARRDAGMELGITSGRKEMFKYLTSLTNRRRVMHELYRSMNDLESFTGLVTRGLRKDGMDFVEKQLVGVSDVQVIYDKVMLSMLSLKKKGEGWLLEDDYDKGDEKVLSILRDSAVNNNDAFNKTYVDASGREMHRPLREWEINRAFNMGRDLSGASERRVVYGILGGVPSNADNFLKSIKHEPIARRLAPLKLIPDRFFGHPVARRFISMLKLEQKRGDNGEINNYKYGYVGKDGKPIGFFGVDQGDTSIIDLTITDPKTNGWRAHLMFLKNPNYKQNIGGKLQTIGDFFDESTANGTFGLAPLGDDASTKERAHRHHHELKDRRKKWNNRPEVKRIISEQRMFLGTLVRQSFLSEENKATLWKNMAQLNPSSMAALFPNEMLDVVNSQFDLKGDREKAIKKWDEIAVRLWKAERMRLNSEASFIKGGYEGPLPSLDLYLEKVGITDSSEIAVIRKLQQIDLDINFSKKEDIDNFNKIQELISKLDRSDPNYAVKDRELRDQIIALRNNANAMLLANANFPFTAFLDDAPETDWSKTSDFDFTRLLVNDHNAYQEGYGHIMGLIDDPTMKPEKAAEVVVESFEKVKGPPGIPGAQRVFEPIIRATAKLRSMNNTARWAGESLIKMLRKPASPIQEYNLQAEVADDEKQTAAFLGALAQKDVLSDDPAERDDFGRTQYERLRDQTDSDRIAVILGSLRLMLQLLGPAFTMEFAKSLGLKL